MTDERPTPAQVNKGTLLLRLASTLGLAALLVWQASTLHSPNLPPELVSADQALAANNEKQARRQLDKLIGQAPTEPALYQAVVTACMLHNRLDLAQAYCERALDACKYAPNGERSELYLLLSEVFMLKPEPPPQPNALAYARRALELAPESPSALNGYGYALADNARTEQDTNIALGYIQKALQIMRAQTGISPAQIAPVEDSLGWALYRRGQYHAEDYARAADTLAQAVDDQAEGTPGAQQKLFYYHLGAACRASGRIPQARRALQVALFYDPKYADALRELQALPDDAPASATPVTSESASSGPNKPTATQPAPTTTGDGKPIFRPLSGSPAKR